jgi:hypothetical protein
MALSLRVYLKFIHWTFDNVTTRQTSGQSEVSCQSQDQVEIQCMRLLIPIYDLRRIKLVHIITTKKNKKLVHIISKIHLGLCCKPCKLCNSLK